MIEAQTVASNAPVPALRNRADSPGNAVLGK